MLSMLSMYDQSHNDKCFLCNNVLTEIKSYPNVCEHLFHYKCLRKYVDSRLDKSESIICPICSKIFNQIGNKYKKSKEILFQNVILSNDETQCCICFSKYKCPVASTDSCTHTFCFECLKKWCTFKHECPMDRMPIKLLLLSDFPGGHITKKEEPPQIEQDLNCDGDNDEILNTTCEICNLGNNDHQLLLCDNCNRGYHIYCLADPLNEIPEGDWFCEDCSEYMGIRNQRLPRNIRGLNQVIDNLESRIYEVGNHRNQRSSSRPGRGRRTRANRNISSDDSDLSEQVIPRPRARRTVTRRSNDAVVTRSRRNRVINSDEEESIVDTRQAEILVNNGSNNELSRDERINEESEEEQETELEESEDLGNCTISITFNEGSSSDKEVTARRRHRQGSLSSEAESELEPSRKKVKTDESTSESSSSTDDDSVTSLLVPTRKRTRARFEDSEPNDEDDEPHPRHVKRLRMIDESSDESNDESRASVSKLKCKMRRIVESNSSDSSEEDELEDDSNNDEQEENEEIDDRKRNFSTSSSLSTIPCRAPSNSRSDAHSSTNLPTINQKKSRSCMKVEDVFSDSSSKDSTDSDYDPFADNTLEEPSTSRRSRSSQNKKTRKAKKPRRSRKTQKKTKTPRKSKGTRKKKNSKKKRTISTRSTRQSLASSSNLENSNSFTTSTTLSLFGREKQLPVVSDEEMKIKQVSRANTTSVSNTSSRQHNSNTSILSEINEAQSNFRQISLATITRLPDGTLVHKTREVEPIISNENKDPKNNIVPSTSSQLPSHSAPPVSSSLSVTQAAVQQSKPPIQQVQPIVQHSQPVVVPAQSISINSSISVPGNTNAAKSSSTDTHITDISVTIKKFLNKFIEKGKITAEERNSLCDRIKEKIMKRNNQRKTPGESSIKEFSKKYLDFYLKKRK